MTDLVLLCALPLLVACVIVAETCIAVHRGLAWAERARDSLVRSVAMQRSNQ